MLPNRYLRRLIRAYSEAVIDDRTLVKIVEKAATVTPEDIGIDKQVANTIIEAYKKLGIDVNRIPDELLAYHVLNLYGQLGGLSDAISDKTYKKAAVAIGAKLKSIEHEHSVYRYGYDKSNRVFSSNAILNKIMRALAMGGVFFQSLPFFNQLKAEDIASYIANNPQAVVSVIETTLTSNPISTPTSKEGVIAKYTPDQPVEKLPAYAKPAVDRIKSKAGSVLPEIYYRFREAGALMDLPKNDTLDISTRLALRIFWSAKILYNKFVRAGKVSFDTLLDQDEKTEMATQHIVFAAMSYNILRKLDYTALGMTSEQVKNLVDDLQKGKYDIKFKNQNNTVIRSFSRNMLIQMLDSDIEFEIMLHEMEVLGLGQISSEIKEQLIKDKVAITPVQGLPFYDLYVILPVTVVTDSMNPVHEVAFKIRCDLAVYGIQPHGASQASININSAPFRYNKTRLFRKKKKYDWM
jgi:hypothetical protein